MADRGTSNPPIWYLGEEALQCIEPGDGETAIVLVPSEDVTTLELDLPLPSRAKRAAALPFAIEDMLAEPIDAVHLALGSETEPRRHVVGVVRHRVMRNWTDRLDAAGLGESSMLPDALALPRPEPGSWSVAVVEGRSRIRTDDGAGLAVPTSLLSSVWAAAGRPRFLSYGEAVPDDMSASGSSAAAPPVPTPSPLNLLQGTYARRRAPVLTFGRRSAAIVVAAIVAHLLIASGDILLLRHRASAAQDSIRALVAKVAPNVVLGDDVAADAAALLPGDATQAAGGFLPLLARTAAAMQPLRTVIQWREIAYNATDGALTLQVEASDMKALATVRRTLADAGLSVVAGPAGTESGRSRGEFTIQMGDRA